MFGCKTRKRLLKKTLHLPIKLDKPKIKSFLTFNRTGTSGLVLLMHTVDENDLTLAFHRSVRRNRTNHGIVPDE
jgi:hypothetical protein